jgi:hypothetical protein
VYLFISDPLTNVYVQRVVSLLQTKLVLVATTTVSALPPGSTGARCTISLAEAHPVAAREAFAECCTRLVRAFPEYDPDAPLPVTEAAFQEVLGIS